MDEHEMKDCISRKEATEFINKCLEHEEKLQSVERETLIAVKKYLESIPAADAIEALSKPKWIPVTERLPESGQRVLAVGLHGEAMYIGTYTGGIKETAYRKAKPYKINAGGYGWRSFTWWMHLPQPPRETPDA